MRARRSVTAQHALAIVEACYSLDGSDNEWLGRVLEAASPDLDQGRGVYGFTSRVNDHTLEPGSAYVERDLDPAWSSRVDEFNRNAHGSFFEVLARTAVLAGGFMENATPSMASHLQTIVGDNGGVTDAFGVFAQDGEGYAVNLAGPAGRVLSTPPRVLGIWKRVGMHLASAMRLRRHLSSSHAACDAILAPDGSVVHAESELREDSTAREKLTLAVRDVERARTTQKRRDPERALELWHGLIAGRWSLVDHWEANGCRYVAAYRNQPDMHDPRGFTSLERVVLPYAALGASNKEIAFALGLSTLSVGTAVGRLVRKLRCRRRSDLVAFANPIGAQDMWLSIGDGEVGVLSVSHGVRSPVANRLSRGERAIANMVVAGQSNAAIARSRGTSPRTIANQLHNIFDKLEVGSRGELVRRLTRD
jgi:DNA-binding NarL/FixJ family response regulator